MGQDIDESARLRRCHKALRDIIEMHAGSELIPFPISCVEDGLIKLAKDMSAIAARALEYDRECRGWVGLSDTERFLNDFRSEEALEYAKAIEALLKAKNGGC